MNWKTSLYSIILVFVGQPILAQETWSLKQVVTAALQQNFDVAIAQNNTTAASNLATRGQAGYYPTIDLNANAGYSNNNTELKFAGGLPDVEVSGAENTILGSNIGFNYVIFNGFGRVHTFRNLMSTQQLNKVQAKVVAENLVLDVVTQYLDLQQNKLNLEAAVQNIVFSKDRLKRATIANQNGAKSRLDVLSAQVDLTNDSLALLTVANAINKQKAILNILMGIDPETALTILDEIDVPAELNIAEIEALALQNNSSILLAQIAQTLATSKSEIAEGSRMPTLLANGSYGYSTAQNGAGIILSQNNLGFSGGLTLTMPIFKGNQLTSAMINADLARQNSELELNKAKLAIRNQLYAAELDSKLLTNTLYAQRGNVRLAEAGLERAQISYSNGQISFNDLRQSQLSLLVAKNNVTQAKINLVKLYYTVSKLGGGLLEG